MGLAVIASTSPERRAYVLDDDPGIRKFVQHVLAAAGYSPAQFSSSLPLLAKLKSEPPELIVLDLALGQSDAVEVICHLEILRYAGKVLLISGRDESTLREIQQIGKSHGLAMLPPLCKPFRSNDLAERLRAQPEAIESAVEVAGKHAPAVDLDEALRKNWLELWYQPKIDLKSMSICGAEALLRARHPEYGVVPPAGILPPSSDPLHQPLSRFVIRQAMADWGHFADAGMPIKLALNMPVSVINAPGFVSVVRGLLPNDSRFPGLIIEVTEDEVIREPEFIREIATQLKLYNVFLSIDDFGSAYSSLSRLLDAPSVEIKIDRRFVSGCATDKLKHALCQTVIDLAHRFGAAVCGEGVENGSDLRALINLGCDTAQGFLFAKPMARQIFIDKVNKRKADQEAAHADTPAEKARAS